MTPIATILLLFIGSCLILAPIVQATSDPTSLLDEEETDQIVGGTKAKSGAYRFQAALVSGTRQLQFCGGSLVDSTHVLTAAHCITSFSAKNPPNFKVYLNTISLTPDAAAVTRNVILISKHPSYNPQTHENDLALLTLNSPVTSITPVALAASNSISYENQAAKIIGWGTTSSGGKQSKKLLEATVKVYGNTQCGSMYSQTMSSSFVCAANPNTDTCQGDSGGPLLVGNNTQIGIVSWGIGCANPYYPGVYTRVSTFASWINTTKATQ